MNWMGGAMLTLLNLSEARRGWTPAGAGQGEPAAAVREAASPLLFTGAAERDGLFRRISQSSTPGRDLLPPMQWNMQRVSYYLYVTNPLARRIVDLTKDFVVGEGVHVKAA